MGTEKRWLGMLKTLARGIVFLMLCGLVGCTDKAPKDPLVGTWSLAGESVLVGENDGV